jgi:hypothetical protein
MTEVVPHPPRYKKKTDSGFYSNTQLSPYCLNTNFWRALPLTSKHLYSSTRCLAQFISPIGRWLQEGVLVGERGL